MPVVPNSTPLSAGEANHRWGVRDPCGTRQTTPSAKSVTNSAPPGPSWRSWAPRRRGTARPGRKVPVRTSRVRIDAVEVSSRTRRPSRLVRHLDAVVLVEVLAGDRPRPQQRAVGAPLEDARRLGAAPRLVGPGVDAAVGVDVDVRRVAGRGDEREHPGVPLRGRRRTREPRPAPQRPAPPQRGRPAGAPPPLSPTSTAARSPARTAPSM